jgi:hypothetical protein
MLAALCQCGSMIQILPRVLGWGRCWHWRPGAGWAGWSPGVRIAAKGGVNAAAKIVALVAGMVAGADSISDMDLLRHCGMGRLFEGVRVPST